MILGTIRMVTIHTLDMGMAVTGTDMDMVMDTGMDTAAITGITTIILTVMIITVTTAQEGQQVQAGELHLSLPLWPTVI